MEKPKWDKPYSVAAATYNHYLWVDLSLLFNCPEGVDSVATYVYTDHIACMFHWNYPNWDDYEKYGHDIELTDEILTQWLEWQWLATDYCQRYNMWQKKYGKN